MKPAIEMRHLATFRVVATTLSFTRAAEALDYAQSSVTAQIQALEEDLGVLLFERLGKRILLTPAGQRLLPYAHQALQLMDEARAAVTQEAQPYGTLTVGAPETLCVYRLPPVLKEFRARCPRVHLVFHPTTTASQRRTLAEGEVDVGFLLDTAPPPEPFSAERLVSETLLVLAAPAHPLAGCATVVPRDLDDETIIVTESGCSYRRLFERSLAAAGATPATTMELGSVEAIKQCSMAGLGVTVLPKIAVAEELAQGQLVALPWAGPSFEMGTYVVWHRDKWLSPALQAFLELTRRMLAPPTAGQEL
jgi:DNA-binding transcriptional LysR family regulator